jgi:hypothetical protein
MSTQQVNYNINVTGNLEAKLNKATKGFDKLDKEVDSLKKKLGKPGGKGGGGGTGLMGAFAGFGPVLAGAFAVERVIAFGKASVEAFDKQAKAIAQVKQGLLSTGGVAERTLDQLLKQASELQKKTLFGDEEILQGATSQLLTFTNISGEQFDKTQQAVLDLSTRLDQDLKSSAIQLGKALNDPVANLSALSRSGIQFSVQQKEVIKSLAETNRLAEAQDIILEELAKQYGGSAEAAAKAGLGPWKQLQNQFGDFSELVGEKLVGGGSGLIPLLTKLTEFLTEMVGPLTAMFKDMVAPLQDAFKEVSSLFGGFGEGIDVVKIIITFLKVLTLRFRVMTSLFAFTVKRAAELWRAIGRLVDKLKEWMGVSSDFPNIIQIYIDAYAEFTKVWDNLPLFLEASWMTFVDFFGNLFDLAMTVAKSIGEVFKESFNIEKLISGDISGIQNVVAKGLGQLKRDSENLSLKATFQTNLQELLKKDAVLKTEEQTKALASSAGALSTAGSAELTKVSDEVTGTKATNINLNIDKLIENLNFNTTSLEESSTKIKDEVTRVLIEALRDTTAIATN